MKAALLNYGLAVLIGLILAFTFFMELSKRLVLMIASKGSFAYAGHQICLSYLSKVHLNGSRILFTPAYRFQVRLFWAL